MYLCFGSLYLYLYFTRSHHATRIYLFFIYIPSKAFLFKVWLRECISQGYMQAIHMTSDNNEAKEEAYAWGVGSGGRTFGTN